MFFKTVQFGICNKFFETQRVIKIPKKFPSKLKIKNIKC